MKRKAVINANMPGYAINIRLRILIETGENTGKYEYRGFDRFYKFYEMEKAQQFAAKYCDVVEIIN